MNPLNKFISSLKALGKGGIGRPNPSRDWLVLLGVGFVLLMVSILWNVWFFGEVVKEEASALGTATSTVPEVYPLGVVQNVFQERAATEIQYTKELQFIDPSL